MDSLQGPYLFDSNLVRLLRPNIFHHVGRQDGKLIEIFSGHNTYNPATGGPLHIPGPGGLLRQSRLSETNW